MRSSTTTFGSLTSGRGIGSTVGIGTLATSFGKGTLATTAGLGTDAGTGTEGVFSSAGNTATFTTFAASTSDALAPEVAKLETGITWPDTSKEERKSRATASNFSVFATGSLIIVSIIER